MLPHSISLPQPRSQGIHRALPVPAAAARRPNANAQHLHQIPSNCPSWGMSRARRYVTTTTVAPATIKIAPASMCVMCVAVPKSTGGATPTSEWWTSRGGLCHPPWWSLLQAPCFRSKLPWILQFRCPRLLALRPPPLVTMVLVVRLRLIFGLQLLPNRGIPGQSLLILILARPPCALDQIRGNTCVHCSPLPIQHSFGNARFVLLLLGCRPGIFPSQQVISCHGA